MKYNEDQGKAAVVSTAAAREAVEFGDVGEQFVRLRLPAIVSAGGDAAQAAASAPSGMPPGSSDARPSAAAMPHDAPWPVVAGLARPGARSGGTKEKASAVDSKGVVLKNGADMTPEAVRWLWRGWLALGKLHILAGAPGVGKTTLAMALAAIVTRGGPWPDGSTCEPGNVIIWSGEDDAKDTLLPRLMAAEADVSRCHFVHGTNKGGEIKPFDPAHDMKALQATARALGDVRLIIIDPVASAVAGNSHRNAEVRRAMQLVVDLGVRLDACVLGLTHLSKGNAGADPVTRILGSVAFTAVARVVLLAAKTKGRDGEDRRLLVRGKSNIGPDTGGIEYTVEEAEPMPGISTSQLVWGDAVDGSASELLDEWARGQRRPSAVDAAAGFLRNILAGGELPAKSVMAEAIAAGISEAAVRRSSSGAGVCKRKTAEGWLWSVPTR